MGNCCKGYDDPYKNDRNVTQNIYNISSLQSDYSTGLLSALKPNESNPLYHTQNMFNPNDKDDQELLPINFVNPDRSPHIIQANIVFGWSLTNKKTDTFTCQLNLAAPEQDSSFRTGVDIICLIDVSGSMERGKRFSMAKKSLSIMISQLREIDRICIISFNHNATKLMPLTIMNNQGKEFATTVVDSLKPSGGTNIVEGLRFALMVALNRKMFNYVLDIVILSTGSDSYQESLMNKSLSLFEEFDIYNISYSVYAFDFGTSHNIRLLRDIAYIKSGWISCIREPSSVTKYFEMYFNQILSVVAINIKVTLTLQPCPRPVSLIEVTNEFGGKIHCESGTANFRLSNISSKRCIFSHSLLRFPPCETQLFDYTIKPIKAYISFIMVATGEIVIIEREPLLEIKNNSRPMLIMAFAINDYKVRTNNIIFKCDELGHQHKFQEGRKSIKEMIRILKDCKYSRDPAVRALVQDLEICMQKLRYQESLFHQGCEAKSIENHVGYQNSVNRT